MGSTHMIITDAGSHIWRAASSDNPWMPGRKAHLEPPIGYEDLRRMMAEAGVHRHVLIPPSWEGDRADYSLEAAAKYLQSWDVSHCRKQRREAASSRRGSSVQACWACVLPSTTHGTRAGSRMALLIGF